MADIATNNMIYTGSTWVEWGSGTVESGSYNAARVIVYGNYSGTKLPISVDINGNLVTSPVVRTNTTSKTSTTGLVVNTNYIATAVFDALAYTRLAGSVEADREFFLLVNQGEDSPITETLMYQSMYYPTLSVIHPSAVVFQAEVSIVAGTCTLTGTVTAIVTSANMTNSPKTVTVNVLNTDTATVMATKIRAGLALDPDVSAAFYVGGFGTIINLRSLLSLPNDTTLNIATANGSATGLTAVPISTHSQAGTAVKQVTTATAVGAITGTGNATVTITSANMTNSPKILSVAVVNGDTTATWAGKVRTALLADSDVLQAFDVSGTTTAMVLTAVDCLANDTTLNIAITNGTCTGITPVVTSTATTAGVAGSIYKYICAFDQELVHRYASVWVSIGSVLPRRFRYGLFATSVVR